MSIVHSQIMVAQPLLFSTTPLSTNVNHNQFWRPMRLSPAANGLRHVGHPILVLRRQVVPLVRVVGNAESSGKIHKLSI